MPVRCNHISGVNVSARRYHCTKFINWLKSLSDVPDFPSPLVLRHLPQLLFESVFCLHRHVLKFKCIFFTLGQKLRRYHELILNLYKYMKEEKKEDFFLISLFKKLKYS